MKAFFLGVPGQPGFIQRLAFGLLVTAGLLGMYHLVGMEVQPGPHSLLTVVDQAIPLIPWTVWFYIPVYVLCFLVPVIVVDDMPAFKWTTLSLVVTAAPCWLVHALVPMGYPRPAVPPGDSFTLAMLRSVYVFDPPHNTFPSLHVALATITVIATWRYSKRAGLLSGLCAALMTISVLTTKQHFIADIFGGWAMATLSWALVLRGRDVAGRQIAAQPSRAGESAPQSGRG